MGPMLNDAEFENEIKEMSDRQLGEFTARQVYIVSKQCIDYDGRITELEKAPATKKQTLATGGISGGVMAVIIGIIEYFTLKSRSG